MLSFTWDTPSGCHRGFLPSGNRQTLTQTMQRNSLLVQAESIRLSLSNGAVFAQIRGGISE